MIFTDEGDLYAPNTATEIKNVSGWGCLSYVVITPSDSKVHGANMGPIWGRQDSGGPHVGPMNFAIWGTFAVSFTNNGHQNQHLSHG